MGLLSGIGQLFDRRVNRRTLAEARDRQLRWIENAIRREKHARSSGVVVAAADCKHAVLLPVWENLGDMGVTERASAFTCDKCRQRFSLEEATALRQATQPGDA